MASLRRAFIPSVVVFVLAVALDVAQWLRNAPLWLDEEMIALNVRDRSFPDLAGPLWFNQSAPLGWLVAMRIVLLAVGTGELALRVIPLLFGVAMLAAAVWIGERWMGRFGAALLVLLCAVGQWLSHFRFEVKHYSADAFWALLLPALAAWALEEGLTPDRARARALAWWCLAAAGQWFSNGALLVAPACAAWLVFSTLRRRGGRAALHAAVPAVIWLAAFGVHYDVSLKYTRSNAYLRSYWSGDLPPDSAGALDTFAWIGSRLGRLGSNPGGGVVPVVLWICAACGFAASRSRDLGILFAAVPLSAFALAALRIVPLHDRLSLWIVPALYAGIALAADAGVRWARDGWRARRWLPLASGAVTAALAAAASADIVRQGYRNLDLDAPRDANHGLDDRSAVRWLMHHRRPGDALMTTRHGWPAVWWYGGISLGGRTPGGQLSDGSVMYRIGHEAGSCGEGLAGVLAHRRVLVYVGFPDVEEPYFDLVRAELAAAGEIAGSARFASLSRLVVAERSAVAETPDERVPPARGCVSVTTARRW